MLFKAILNGWPSLLIWVLGVQWFILELDVEKNHYMDGYG